jgi:hypothetical protein
MYRPNPSKYLFRVGFDGGGGEILPQATAAEETTVTFLESILPQAPALL